MQLFEKRHFYILDALRFFSFLAVFVSHAFFTKNISDSHSTFLSLLHLGRLGVDFFFVLSSFLITWIILEELDNTKDFKIGFFYIRRTLRIWPLYFLIVFIGFSIIYLQPILTQLRSPDHPSPPLLWFVFFICNFWIAFHGDNFLFLLVFLWSIAIEEQFYLFWGVLMKFMGKFLNPICLLLIAVSLWFRYVHLNDNHQVYFHTFSALGNFAVGALIAKMAYGRTKLFLYLSQLSQIPIAFAYLIFFCSIIFYNRLFNYTFTMIVERLVFSLLFGFIIFEQCFCKNSFIKFGRWKSINYLGKISYGLYCFHGVVITLFIKASGMLDISNHPLVTFVLIPCSIFILTVFISTVSYEYYEKKFIELRKKFY